VTFLKIHLWSTLSLVPKLSEPELHRVTDPAPPTLYGFLRLQFRNTAIKSSNLMHTRVVFGAARVVESIESAIINHHAQNKKLTVIYKFRKKLDNL
jgi:hypothetical protein